VTHECELDNNHSPRQEVMESAVVCTADHFF
jgi:hypothetical protein